MKRPETCKGCTHFDFTDELEEEGIGGCFRLPPVIVFHIDLSGELIIDTRVPYVSEKMRACGEYSDYIPEITN